MVLVPSRIETVVNAVVFGNVFILQVVQFLPLAKTNLLKDFKCEAVISMLLDSSSELVCSVCFVSFFLLFVAAQRARYIVVRSSGARWDRTSEELP